MSNVEHDFRKAADTDYPDTEEVRSVIDAVMLVVLCIVIIAAAIFAIGFATGRATASPEQDQWVTALKAEQELLLRESDSFDKRFWNYVDQQERCEYKLQASTLFPVLHCEKGRGG